MVLTIPELINLLKIIDPSLRKEDHVLMDSSSSKKSSKNKKKKKFT